MRNNKTLMKFVKFGAFTLFVLLLWSCDKTNDTADAYGNFRANEIIISAETAGKVYDFRAEEGDSINAGDTLCKIDTELLSIKTEQVEAQMQAAKNKFSDILAQVKVLREKEEMLLREKNRVEKLLKDSAATQKQMDDINSELDILNRQIDQVKVKNQSVFDELAILEKQKEYLQAQVGKGVIISPIKGHLLEKYVETYEVTAPGKPLCKIADISQMILKVYLSGDQLDDVEIGKTVKVYIDKNEHENREYSGKLSMISDKAEFTPKIIQTKKERVNLVYAAEIMVENDGKIKIGMPGEIKFTQQE
jgi:HlyD family secretion protein